MGNSNRRVKITDNMHMETEPNFYDDFHSFKYLDPVKDEARKEFDRNLKQGMEGSMKDINRNTRTLEIIMFLCFYELTLRSFDYHELARELKEEHEKYSKSSISCLPLFLETAGKNVSTAEKLKFNMEVKRYENENDYYLNSTFKSPKLSKGTRNAKEVKRNEESEDPKEKERFNEFQKVSIDSESTLIHDSSDNEENGNTKRECSRNPITTKQEECDNVSQPLTQETNETEKFTETHLSEEENRQEEDSILEFENQLLLLTSGEKKKHAETKAKLDARIHEKKREIEEQRKQYDEETVEEMKHLEEKLKAADKEFRKAEEEKQRICDEEIRKIREKRKEYENETERIRLENSKELQTMLTAFLTCVELKQKWKMKEEEWADWLKFIRSAVSRIKQQYIQFESLFYSWDFGDQGEELMKEELHILHKTTLSNFDILYKAYFDVKTLSEQNPDRIFLWILLNQISKVCKAILPVLYGIDNAKINEDLREILEALFSTFDSSDIFYTTKLRKLEKSESLEELKTIKDPDAYTPKCSVIIEEAVEETNHERGRKLETKYSDFNENRKILSEECSENSGNQEMHDVKDLPNDHNNCQKEEEEEHSLKKP